MNTAKESQSDRASAHRSTDAIAKLNPVRVTEQQPLSQHDAPLKLKYSLSTMILIGTLCAGGFIFGLFVALALV